MTKILLINGPNLNLLGNREPDIYGSTKLQEIENKLTGFFKKKQMQCLCFQSNHEGEILDFIQLHKDATFLILNAGALTHTSIALKDVLQATNIPFIEVHISNIYSREEFRKHSYISDIASGIIIGCGVYGYELAAEYVIEKIQQ